MTDNLDEDQAGSPRRSQVLELASRAGLSATQTEAVLRRAFAWPTLGEWQNYGRTLGLSAGTGLLLAGIIFFFAYNWSELHHFTKLGIVAGVLLSCGLASSVFYRHALLSQSLQVAIFVLCGTLLALFGQIYQTGANAYDLFFGWVLLTIPLALVSTSWVVWFLWILVANVAAHFYGGQVLGGWLNPNITMGASGLSMLALLGFELYRRYGKGQVGGRSFALLVAVIVLARPVIDTCIYIHADSQPNSGLLGALTLLALVAGGYVYFALIRDLSMLALVALGGMGIFFSAFIRATKDEPAIVFFFGSLLLIGMTAGLVIALLRIKKYWEEHP